MEKLIPDTPEETLDELIKRRDVLFECVSKGTLEHDLLRDYLIVLNKIAAIKERTAQS